MNMKMLCLGAMTLSMITGTALAGGSTLKLGGQFHPAISADLRSRANRLDEVARS